MSKVLLVEDDNNLREIFEMRLKAEGYDTVVAGDGEEGIVIAMKEKPDLAVVDVMMPKLSGFEMLETLKAAPEMNKLKVVMMTALGQAEDQARGQKLGVVKYLVKSQVTLEDFIRVIREILPPGQAATDSSAGSTAASPAVDKSSSNNNQESEQKMPEDPQPTTPAPDAPQAPADSNPITTPSTPVGGGVVGGDQQTSDQEKGAVQDQISSFVSSPAEPATPAGDSGAMPSAPVTGSDIPVTPPPASDPAAPAAPAADSGAPAETPPPADPPVTAL